ncbi:hypothetical protein L915_21023 [Phytophthora nicotianae]|nr:hypothetical protein L915_21023 [Phytophthora nicotianae]
MTKAIAKLLCSEQARQRELRRQRQVQYRKKKDKYEKDLAEEICRCSVCWGFTLVSPAAGLGLGFLHPDVAALAVNG